MFHSIKAKVVTTYSLLMIAFISLLLLAVFVNERDNILKLELENSSEISKMHAALLSKEFAKYVAMLRMLSDDPQIKSNDQAAIIHKLQRLINIGNGDFINAIYVDNELNLTDASGGHHKVDHPLFLRNEQWENKTYNITVPLYSRFTSEPVVIVAVPSLDVNNKWLGTLAVAVPLAVISNKLSSIKLSKGSFAWLTDSNDLVVSHPIQDFVMKVTLQEEESETFPDFYKITKQTRKQHDGYGQYLDMINNESKIVTFSKIDYLPGWNFFITTSESEVFREINNIMRNILMISILLTAIFLLLISRLSNRITKPIVELTKSVKEAKNGNDLILVNAKDEIGELSKAFYDSAQKIYQHTTNLEQMIVYRTQEISNKNQLLSEQNDKLEELASKDSLTQLYNRRAFNVLVEKEISRASRHGHCMTLVLLDIDDFKAINDKCGHNVGDDVLRRVATVLLSNVRKENIVCRWGGEEFVILIPETTSDVVFDHMETIRKTIEGMDFSPANKVTFSAGMATMLIDESFEDWLQRADRALYRAKVTGRNKIIKA